MPTFTDTLRVLARVLHVLCGATGLLRRSQPEQVAASTSILGAGCQVRGHCAASHCVRSATYGHADQYLACGARQPDAALCRHAPGPSVASAATARRQGRRVELRSFTSRSRARVVSPKNIITSCPSFKLYVLMILSSRAVE